MKELAEECKILQIDQSKNVSKHL